MALQKYHADKPGKTQTNSATPWFSNWMDGPSLALLRNCLVQNRPHISPRTIYITGMPDTYFSIPAACKYKGKTVLGYVGMEDNEFYFRAINGFAEPETTNQES
jgi:hypothetical protein